MDQDIKDFYEQMNTVLAYLKAESVGTVPDAIIQGKYPNENQMLNFRKIQAQLINYGLVYIRQNGINDLHDLNLTSEGIFYDTIEQYLKDIKEKKTNKKSPKEYLTENLFTTAGGIVGGLILAILIYYFGIKS